MRLTPPFPISTITQHFGGNANPLYAGQGLKGHTGTDFGEPWGVAVKAAISGPIAWIYNKNSKNLMDYRAVGQMIEGGDGFYYEVSYGHLSDIYVSPGQYVNQGDVIARVGNTGECYVGQHEVTEAEKESGSHAGAHLHFQVRKCVARTSSKAGADERIITDDYGAYTLKNGDFVFAINYNNGYNGCIDPEQFFTQSPNFAFTRDLYMGISGQDVKQLQQYLNNKGFLVSTSGPGSPGNETAFFGGNTKAALTAFQAVNHISPASGYFGPITRNFIAK